MESNPQQPDSERASTPKSNAQQQQIFFVQMLPNQRRNGDWQSDKDYEHRRKMIAKIVHLLQQRKPNAPQEWRKKLPQMARKLEEVLYRSAKSFSDYNDVNTLFHRLKQLFLHVEMETRKRQQQQALAQQQPTQHETRLQQLQALHAQLQEQRNRQHEEHLQEQRARHETRMQQIQAAHAQLREQRTRQHEEHLQEQRARHEARMQQHQAQLQDQLAQHEARMQQLQAQMQFQRAQHEARMRHMLAQHETRMQRMRAQRANRGFRRILRMIGVHEAMLAVL